MSNPSADFVVVSAWIEKTANAVVGAMGTAHAPITKRGPAPVKGKRWYLGAIYPAESGNHLEIVVRTKRYAEVAAKLKGWSVRVTDARTGAPRVWVKVPAGCATPAKLAELEPLLAVWGSW